MNGFVVRGRVFCSVLLVLLAGGFAVAQYDAEHFSVLNFRYQNPGARARGMGGAFVGLADDATAAYVNPAGIAFLEGMEFSIEYSNERNRWLAGRRTNDYGTRSDYQPMVSAESNDVSFASLLNSFGGGRFVAGAYYVRLIDQDKVSGRPGGCDSVFIPTASVPDSLFYYYPTSIRQRAQLDAYGAALGVRLSDALSVGVTAARAKMRMVGESRRFGFPSGGPSDPLGRGEPLNSEVSTVDDTATLWTFGALWQPTARVSLGFSWQNEMKFAMDNREDVFSLPDGSVAVSAGFSSTLTTPSRIAVGIGVTVTDRLTLSAEVDRIQYGDLLKGMDHGFFDTLRATYEDEELVGISWDPEAPRMRYEADDIKEYHVGAEYSVATKGTSWSLRAGYWRNRGHGFFVTGGEPGADFDYVSRKAWANPRERSQIHHWTAGVGVAVNAFMFDFAVDAQQGGPTSWVGSLVIRVR